MLKQKLIALILTLTMMGTYLITLGNVAIAASESLSTQNSKTNNSSIEFNSYFEGGEHSKIFEIGKEAKLYLEIKVKKAGYLKNGVVQFSNANFEIDTEKLDNTNIQSSSKTEIKLKQINNNSNPTIIEIPVVMKNGEEIESDFFSKVNKVTFTGTYIDENGKENSVKKEIRNELIWQGEAELNLSGNLNKIKLYEMAEEKGVLLQAVVKTGIKDNTLPVTRTRLEVTMPELKIENEAGEEVEVTPTRATVVANSTKGTNGKGSTEFTEANYTYNAETNKIEINVENAEQDGKISWAKSAEDEYVITYVYAGEEIYNYIREQLEKAEETIKTEEQIKAGEVNENAITGEIELTANVGVHGAKTPEISKTEKINYNLERQSGEILETSINSTESISKGYIYANYAKETKEENEEPKKDTSFDVNYTVQVYDKSLTDGITLETVAEKYIDGNEEEYSSKVNNKDTIYSKSVSISKEIFNKMLGEEGKIEITNKKGEKLAEITKDTENYTANIEEAKVNEIIIKTTKPITEGRITVSVEKAISAEQGYSKENMQDFKKITLGVIGGAEKNTEIELTEPITKAEISIEENKKNLSTVLENKDVNIKIVLDTSSVEKALYKNPVIEIRMPKQVKKIDINSINLLLEDELKIKETKILTRNNQQIIKISLSGTQTKYYGDENTENSNIITKGANIVLNADITLDQLATSGTEKILMYYINENTNLYEETYELPSNKYKNQVIGMTTTEVEIIAQTGVVVANGISNYSEDGEEILTISDGVMNSEIETYTEKRIATITGKMINNYDNKIGDIIILGRIPAKANIQLGSNQNLQSTFDALLNKELKLTGIDENNYEVYYSDKINAGKELDDSNNNWVTKPTKNSKSYMVVTKDYEMQSGEAIDFNYQIEIPENLSYNNNSYEMYTIYYNNISSDGTISETKVSPVIGMSTGNGPNVELTLNSANDTAREGQIVRMKVEIKNTGDIEVENAKLLIEAPEGTVHTEMKKGTTYFRDSKEKEKVIELGNIKPGATIKKEYDLKIEKGTSLKEIQVENKETGETETITVEENKYPGDKQIENIVRVSADNINNEVKSESFMLNVLKGDLSITNTSKNSENTILRRGDKIEYRVKVENISYDKNLKNIIINVPLPEGTEVEDVYYILAGSSEKVRDNITTNQNTVSIKIEELDSLQVYLDNELNNGNINTSEPQEINICSVAEIYINFTITDFQDEYDCIITATADNIETHYSNVQKLIAEKIQLSFEQKQLTQMYIKEGTEYTYHFVVKNIGTISSILNEMKMTLPDGLSLVKAEYELNGEKETITYSNDDGTFTIKFYELAPGETLDIIVTVKAELLPDKNDKEVKTIATLSAKGFEEINSNEVRAIIEYDEDAHKNQGTGGNTTNVKKHYKITGTAWLDANKDGKRDEGEELLSGIEVMLIYKSNSNIVTDVNSGERKITTTNEEGAYEFNNLLPDEYLVVFLYDAGRYDITDYQKNEVSENYNSDAMSMRIVLDGKQTYAGVTDTITISDDNERDIDIGLYVSEKFDLRLDKYISKLTLTKPSAGTKVYYYDNSKLTKMDFYERDINNSSMIVEYRIVVTNEGQVPGYVKKIIDYLPEDVKFSSELNKDWYISNDNGVVYNTALENEKLEPGQSKEVTLVLSINITDKNIGKIINNNAEIYESYNEQGLKDFDSIEANKLETEDDISNADIMISLATGKVILYITLAIAIIVLLAFGIYEIKKRVLNKK